ncbi:MAG: hypothetical protein IPL71_05655 [Anaerolineales bacterium]|uniref:hypothetical protein n=1 Tax=Candidatus Villigracilis proximus TaxID=3140683 RepID=UPI003136810E|nr:hypothetical protein [Anaerolineales bacterium]
MMQRILRGLEITLALTILVLLTGYSNPSLTDKIEKVRTYTRQIEFNYVSWMTDAALLKMRAASIGAPYTLDHAAQKQIVTEYLRNTQSILEKEYFLEKLYADASITDKELASQTLRAELAEQYARQKELAPLAESILQDQVSRVIAELGLTVIGQPVPNVWYHSTPLPMALIVSPRDHIEQTANISVTTDLTLDEQAALESKVDQGLNTSSLVVGIGGVGVYPTMVMRTTNLNWTLSTVAHEWIHNYLTLRPLGILYGETPELRTMNETTASIAGDEIGALVIKQFYPELMTASDSTISLISAPNDHREPGDFLRPPFDFREAMHETRITADAFLAEGKIEEAEAYMESRRAIFLQNGYLLRKINQAYFAFHGAYADSPGGAAGQDPVGPAVRALREQSDSLADFVNTISWMTNFEQLKEAVNQ